MVEEGDLGFAQVFVTNISSNNQQTIMPESVDSQVSFQQILPTLVQIFFDNVIGMVDWIL